MQNTHRFHACLTGLCLTLTLPAMADEGAKQPPVATAKTDSRNELLMSVEALRTFGLESAWQATLPLVQQVQWDGAKMQIESGDAGSVYAWDGAGALIALDRTSGGVRWQSAGLGDKERVVDVLPARVDGRDMAIMLGSLRCVVLDGKTGDVTGTSDYAEIPSTVATMFGSECIYGSASRKLVWTRFENERVPARTQAKIRPGVITSVPGTTDAGSHVVMRQIRAMQMRGSFESAPVGGANDMLVVTTGRGEVSCVNKDSGAVLWQTKLAGGVVATPALANGTVFVGSKDQYLRAFDMTGGRTLWKWFAPAELDNPPAVCGDLVLVQVPGAGLAALRANASDKPDGDLKWISDKALGNAISRNAEGVLCWDAASSTLSLIDDRTGGVRQTMQAPNMQTVWCSAPVNGDLMMLNKDGRLQRCRTTSKLAVEAPTSAVKTPKAPAKSDAKADAGDEANKPADAESTKPDA
jgi:outer membrane protein assembly factor BamB